MFIKKIISQRQCPGITISMRHKLLKFDIIKRLEKLKILFRPEGVSIYENIYNKDLSGNDLIGFCHCFFPGDEVERCR